MNKSKQQAIEQKQDGLTPTIKLNKANQFAKRHNALYAVSQTLQIFMLIKMAAGQIKNVKNVIKTNAKEDGTKEHGLIVGPLGITNTA